MIKKKKIYVVIAVVLSTVVMGYAATGNPGSQEDPLVTKSYVEKKIDDFKLYVDRIVGSTSAAPGEGVTFAPVQLMKGKTLIAGEGAEIIPRDGAQLTAIYGSNGGLCDVTDGKDLKPGDSCEVNHMLISARNDGRGVTALVDSWLIIKGSYTVK